MNSYFLEDELNQIQLCAAKDMAEAEVEAIALIKATWEDVPKRVVTGNVVCRDEAGVVQSEKGLAVPVGCNTFWYAINDCDPEEIGCVADMIEAEREARTEAEWSNMEDFTWVTVKVEERNGDEVVNSLTFKMAVGEVIEPDCIEPDHVFESTPFCKDNEEVCKHCGWFRVDVPESEEAPAHFDWREPDSASREWIEREHGMNDIRECALRGLIEPTIRRAIRHGSDNVTIPSDLFNLDDEIELEYSATKTREGGESEIEIELLGCDSWNESGERQADFIDDLVEEVVEGTIEWIHEQIAEHFAIET